jgi:hypothetical protein
VKHSTATGTGSLAEKAAAYAKAAARLSELRAQLDAVSVPISLVPTSTILGEAIDKLQAGYETTASEVLSRSGTGPGAALLQEGAALGNRAIKALTQATCP